MAEKPQITCDVCKVQLSNAACVIEHEKGKKHLKNKAMFNVYPGIHITGFAPMTRVKHVFDHFKKYAEIVGYSDGLDRNFMQLSFKDDQAIEKILQNKHTLNNRLLKVNRRIDRKIEEPFKWQNRKAENAIEASHIETNVPIVNRAELKGDFNDQLMFLISQVRLNPDQVRNMANLCSDVENDLGQVFPGCRARPFGSMVTGLGTKGSDVDCFVEFSGNYMPEDTDDDKIMLQKQYLKKAKSVLYRCHKTYSNIITIPRASTPIIKFYHKPTKTNCDVNFKDCIGVLNSDLIRYLLMLDQRLLPMFIFLKYLGKAHGYSGPSHFTNYALTMMAFFYLQQPPNNIIPTIRSLQAIPEFDNYQDGWNCGFSKHALPENSNILTLTQLLEGFFKFYSTFNYNTDVICPYLGIAIPKDKYKNASELPEELEVYKKYIETGQRAIRIDSVICVQDPFRQSHNITGGVGANSLANFQMFCNEAAAVCEKANKDGTTNVMIKELLDISVKIHKTKKVSIKLPKPRMKEKLQHPADKTIQSADLLKKTKEFLEDAFCKIIKCTIKIDYTDANRTSFFCEANCITWIKRKQIPSNIKLIVSNLDKEIAISEHLMSKAVNVDNTKVLMSFFLDIFWKNKEPYNILSLRKGPINHESYGVFVEYCKLNITKLYDEYMAIHNEASVTSSDANIGDTNANTTVIDTTNKTLKRQKDLTAIDKPAVDIARDISPPEKVSKISEDVDDENP